MSAYLLYLNSTMQNQFSQPYVFYQQHISTKRDGQDLSRCLTKKTCAGMSYVDLS